MTSYVIFTLFEAPRPEIGKLSGAANSTHLDSEDVHCFFSITQYIPYRTKLFIEINVREIRNCVNRENFKLTKTYIHQLSHNYRTDAQTDRPVSVDY